jgi:hypothetical protein
MPRSIDESVARQELNEGNRILPIMSPAIANKEDAGRVFHTCRFLEVGRAALQNVCIGRNLKVVILNGAIFQAE